MQKALFFIGCVYSISIVIFFHVSFVLSRQTVLLEEMKTLRDYGIYYSLNMTREILMRYYDGNNYIRTLLDEYDFRCTNNKLIYQKNYPLFTVEGPHRRTRSMVAQKLAKKIRARVVGNPPQFMIMSNYFFNDTMEMRRAFYSLGVYAAACRAQEFLMTSPVIIAGYWIDQAAFGIAKMFDDLPLERSGLYEWPLELMKPDCVYLINPSSNYFPVHPYRPIKQHTFRDKLLETMLRFRNPSVTEITSTTRYDDIVADIVDCINERFNTQYT